LESIVATDFNFSMKTLISSCYTRKEFRATSTSGFGRVSVQVTVWYRRLILAPNVGSVK